MITLDDRYPSIGDNVIADEVDCDEGQEYVGRVGLVIDHGADGAPKVLFAKDTALFCPKGTRIAAIDKLERKGDD